MTDRGEERAGMNRQFRVKAVMFDLDGTLVDSAPDLTEAARRMLADLGEPPRDDDEVTNFVGKGMQVLVERLLSVGRAPASAERVQEALAVFLRHYEVTNGQRTRSYPHVESVLALLHQRGLRMGCVTNKPEAFTRPLLEKVGLLRFMDSIVGGDTLPQRKPAPEPLWHACALAGVAPVDTLMVGDSGNDALCARNAGIPVVLMTYGYNEGVPVDTVDCDGLVSSFLELPGLIVAA